MKTKILDVTLRDGGYQNNWDFSQINANAIVSSLDGAGLDWVEIGYRNGVPGYTGVGLSGMSPNDYISAIRAAAPNARLSVMYHPGAVTDSDFEQMAQLGVQMVRCSIPDGGLEQSLPLIRKALDLGLVSTANMTTVTEYKIDDLVDDCNRVVDNGCSVIYLADSNGTMTPQEVRALFELIHERVQPIELGFHNHNNLGMAMANAIEAMKSEIAYIDSTLRGMGRSAGNVPTESLVAFLQKSQKHDSTPDLLSVLRIAQYLEASFATADPHPALQDMALGAYDFFTDVQPFITEAASEYDVSWYALIDRMSKSHLDKPEITLQTVLGIARSMIGSSGR